MAITQMEKKIINYLIYNAIRNKKWNELDTTFVDQISNRISHKTWQGIYSKILKQLELNPLDRNGYSITPQWVKDAYIEYRNSDTHDMWKPNGVNLESITNMQMDLHPEKIVDVQTNSSNVKSKPIDVILWSEKSNGNTFHILTKEGTPEYIKGYLDAMGCCKVYKAHLEETEIV